MRKILVLLILSLSFSITSSLTNAQTNAPAGKLKTGTGIAAGGGLAQQITRGLGAGGLGKAAQSPGKAITRGLGMALEMVTGTTPSTTPSTRTR